MPDEGLPELRHCQPLLLLAGIVMEEDLPAVVVDKGETYDAIEDVDADVDVIMERPCQGPGPLTIDDHHAKGTVTHVAGELAQPLWRWSEHPIACLTFVVAMDLTSHGALELEIGPERTLDVIMEVALRPLGQHQQGIATADAVVRDGPLDGPDLSVKRPGATVVVQDPLHLVLLSARDLAHGLDETPLEVLVDRARQTVGKHEVLGVKRGDVQRTGPWVKHQPQAPPAEVLEWHDIGGLSRSPWAHRQDAAMPEALRRHREDSALNLQRRGGHTDRLTAEPRLLKVVLHHPHEVLKAGTGIQGCPAAETSRLGIRARQRQLAQGERAVALFLTPRVAIHDGRTSRVEITLPGRQALAPAFLGMCQYVHRPVCPVGNKALCGDVETRHPPQLDDIPLVAEVVEAVTAEIALWIVPIEAF